MDVGQPEVSPLKLIGQPFVVYTQQMQDRRLEVVNRHRIGDDVVAVIIGFAQ